MSTPTNLATSDGPSRRLVWYFDFISPYAYLQFALHPDLFARPDVTLRPVVFAGLLNHWGHKGPAEIPAKRIQTFRQVAWLAAAHGLTLKCPPAHPFNPIHALRLAIARGATAAVVDTIFDFIWREGRAVNEEWANLCARLGVRDPDVINSDSIKQTLRDHGTAAVAAGVYGVSTFVVDSELFWGLDATPMLRAYLADPGVFATPEMRRISHLPASAERKT